ncbi:MAG: RHS repeat-associated core domain-containing protein, partial [Lachnospiraceae bacterium]|nr:RHS repeat-associated core domain-containing protein [Lachnospiraceae bacterium]
INTEYALTCYVNDINREYTEVLTEYTVSGSKTDNIFSSITGTEEIQVLTDYVYGNQRIYGTGDTTAYYLYDGTGSVTEQVNQRADLLNTYRYDPYGTLTSGNVGESNYYGYRGEETNPTTGMQYLRYRYYDTAAGRFQTPDSYLGSLIQPISQNRYGYTGNNPVMYGDKSGHMPQLIAGMLIGGVIGGMVGGVIGLNAGWISGAIESYQRQKATGSVNYGIVFRDSVIGGISGGIGGFVGGAIEGALTVAAPSPLSQVPVSAFSNTVDGAITRYTESLLYNWFTNEPHVNPVSNALDPTSLAVDVVIGGAGGLVGFGTDKIAGKIIKNLPAEKAIADFIYGRQDTCFSQGADTIADITAEPVEDGAKKVKDFIDNIFGKKNDIDETAEAVGKNSDVTDAGTTGGHVSVQGGSSVQGVGNPVRVEGRGSTGRTIPNTLEEQMAMNQVMSNPLEGAIDLSQLDRPVIMNDPRWPASEGWIKMSNNVNGIEIHFVYNRITGEFDDFKFK